MKRLHFITLGEIHRINDKYYTKKPIKDRPVITDEFSQYFKLVTHLRIKQENEEKKAVLYPLNSDDDRIFEHFIDKEGLLHFLRYFFYYRKKLLSLPEDDIFFLVYPFRRILMLCAFILRKRKLVVWVKTDSVAIQRSNQFKMYGFSLKAIFNTLSNPFKSLFYILFSRFIFKNNLIFYTANIVYNKKEHRNQHEMISCSKFNCDNEIIKKNINHKICFVASEHHRKGFNILLKALSESELKEKVTLNVIGMSEVVQKRNKKLIKNLKVDFHGRITDRGKYYDILSQNDILVMPSFGEKQGKVQLEAMSVGVVPICSDSGGTYKTISNYYNGILFKPGNYRELRSKIEELYNDRELWEDIKANGLYYIKDLSQEKQFKKMAKTINNFYGRS